MQHVQRLRALATAAVLATALAACATRPDPVAAAPARPAEPKTEVVVTSVQPKGLVTATHNVWSTKGMTAALNSKDVLDRAGAQLYMNGILDLAAVEGRLNCPFDQDIAIVAKGFSRWTTTHPEAGMLPASRSAVRAYNDYCKSHR